MTSPFDWSTFSPKQRATLVFVRRGDELLLIHKKRGLGAGKINGPGGRLDPGESPVQCAVREVQEELHVTPIEPKLAGELLFQFVDEASKGLSIHGYVFLTDRFTGTPTETDEAVPLWTRIDKIPFDRMWTDDALWMPHLLAGRLFMGKFVFHGEQMLWHDVSVV
ncbi:MAG: 8-oxo-dGTP diphosphatase [Tepidisphaeraceae bacterium]